MEKGKVVVISGNKRAGKTTLSVKLHKEAGYNFYNFDAITDAIDEGIYEPKVHQDTYYWKFFEEMVESSLSLAENYGINTVIDTIEFMPYLMKDFKYLDKIEVYYLANLDATIDNVKMDMLTYSKPYDWPSYASEADINRNVNFILNRNEYLKEECEKYGFRLINTSRADNRLEIINNTFKEITEGLDKSKSL